MMLFSNFVLSKLTSRLRPWLLEDPESELQLGFLASQGYARSLSFNPSVLNPLIGDCTRLEFKLVEIGELRVCFRPWSSPSIVVEVQGLHVILSPREPNKRQCASGDLSARKKKETIASLDPEGASLHDAIVRLLHLDDPGNRFMTSWVDVISSCSEIKFHDTLLELQLLEESHVCLLEMDKCYFEPQFLRGTSFFRKFLGSFLMTGKGSELSISFHMLKFGMKKNNHVSCIMSSSVFFAYIKLIGVNVWSNSICVASMDIKLSPEVTKVLSLMLDVLSSNEHSAVRTGKELWRRAAERKHLLTGNPKSSFQNVVEMVVLWLRYVRIYNSLLKQVFTLEATYLKENLGKVPIRKRLSVHSKNQFGLIFELEQKLPAQAVAQARRIARKDTLFSSTDLIPSIGQVNSVLRKIFEPFWLLWKLICFVLLSISNSVSIFLKVLGLHYDGSHWSRSLKHVNSSCFSFTEVLITFSFSTPTHSPITEEGKKEAEVNPPTFCLVVRQACIVCKTRDTKVSVFAALGEIKLCLCSLHVQLHRDFTGKRNKPLSSLRSGSHDQSKDIIWSSPALLCRPQEVTDDNSLKNFSIILDNHVRTLWLKWKKISETLELNILQEDKAFLLCEFKSYLTKPNVENTVHGLWKCSLNVGKLSIDLDYKSMFSAGFLLREMKPNNRWATRVGRKQATSFSSSTLGDNCEITVENKIEIYVNKFLAAISHMIPHKNIHAGALISGLDIHISLEEKSSEVITPATAQGNSYHWFEVHIGIMELVIWPATKAVLAAITGEAHIGEATSQYIWLKEPRLLDTNLKHNEYVTFNSHVRHTVNASLRFTALSASSGFKFSTYTQILEPVSLEIMASICRDYWHSFYATEEVLSVALTAVMPSATLLLCLDELRALFHFFNSLVLELASSYNCNVCHGLSSSHDVAEQLHNGITCIVGLLDATFEIQEVDIFLAESRISYNTMTSQYDGPSTISSSYGSYVPSKAEKRCADVGFLIQKSCIQVSQEVDTFDALIDLSGFQTVIFDHQILLRASFNACQIKNLLSELLGDCYQLYLASCTLRLHSSFIYDIMGSSSANNLTNIIDSADWRVPLAIEESHCPVIRSRNLADAYSKRESRSLLGTCTHRRSSGCLFGVDAEIGSIVVSEYHGTKTCRESGQLCSCTMTIFFLKGLHNINCKTKGGCIYLEALALAMFLSCFQEYSLLIASFTPPVTHSSRESFVIGVSGNNLATQGSSCTNEPALRCMSSSSFSNTRFITWNFTEALAVDLKQFSITLAVPDHLGKVQEFVLEVDVFISLLSFGKKLILDLSRLSVFSNRFHKNILNESREMPTLHFYSKMPISSTSQNSSKSGLKGSECESSQRVDAYASSPSDFQNKVGSSLFGSYCHHSILKHMAGTVTVEKLNLEDDNLTNEYNSNWAGRGAISGLNLMIHLWDIQTILALCALFSDILPSEVNGSSMQNLDGGQNFRFEESESDYKIPDGAIVAVQDLHQHMYFTVERLDDKYHLVGALHYSLVGERALFKVKYHRRWRSRVPCMSFLSLYAKNKEGQPLCMSFNPGSGFVGISGSNGKGASLWETFQNEFGCFEDNYADDFRTFSSVRKAFHLVNLKNDSSVAFVNGMPEFVRKPGNPFKVKLFDWSILGKGFAELVSRSLSDNDYDTQCPGELSGTIGDRSEFHYNHPHVNIVVHVATLTILHDVSDVDDQLPLFRCCLNKFTIIGQILLTKLRIISLFSVVLQLFDAITNSWKEIMAPVDSVLFYRSRFTQLDRLIRSHGVPRHFFFHSTQVDITLTEISLDILLYLAGKMDLAGPYAVRQSSIFRNCCKLVNCTGLIVYCHFPKKEKVVLSPGQSSSVFLRFAALDGQLPESDRSMSISLCDNGGISTLPLDVSLSNACHFAWRTRIVSPKDSKTLPGPFIVIEVVHNDEEGLSVAISPLLKIHNESKLSMELQFRRPGETTTESASILLETGDSVDDSIAVFDALDFHGGSKRTLLSLSLGNFLLSLRPRINKYVEDNERNILLNWSEEIKGGKALRISGLFDKLNYRLRNALGVGPAKSFFSSLDCSITFEGQPVSNLYFIIHTIRTDVPLFQPQNVGDATVDRTSPVATQLQKEIFVYPTVQVYNLLQSEILVLLIDSHPDIGNVEFANIGREATIPCHSSSYFYANPDNMHFRITLSAYGSSSKPVNCGVWVNNLERKRNDVHFVDVELDFGGGTYFAFLRLSSSDTGTIKATIFTTYTLENNSEHSLVCYANLKSHTWVPPKLVPSNVSPDLGCLLPPQSKKSWFLKSNKLYVSCLEEKASASFLDLDVLTGSAELSLESRDDVGLHHITKLGVSLQSYVHEVCVPTQVVYFVPRFIISNECEDSIFVRQCYPQDDNKGDVYITVEAKQKVELPVRKNGNKSGGGNHNSLFRRHANGIGDTQFFVQFCKKEVGCTANRWSGPICIASLGRFFLKFKGNSVIPTESSSLVNLREKTSAEFAAVSIVEEKSSLIICFNMPPDIPLPYRIENLLRGSSIKYYQKGSAEPDILLPGASAGYVWDDLSLPHKLTVEIADFHLMREINIDKICEWKAFFKAREHNGLLLHLPFNKQPGIKQKSYDEWHGLEILEIGFEVYADGSTRVLRICRSTSRIGESNIQPSISFQLRLASVAVHFLEKSKQMEYVNPGELSNYKTVIVARLGNVSMDSLITCQYKYNYMTVQSFTVDEKWEGAPFASMVRRSQEHDSGMHINILRIFFVLQPAKSNIKQIKYSSIILQPMDLKVDEETLMKLVQFWRSSSSSSTIQSRQFYFKHFEIHPVKITASFLPGNQYPVYSSAQQALRSFLHSILKMPSVSNVILELNGVLLSHALVTSHQLLIKCAQHYSWYLIRSVYIAKGSSLLPPVFASIFDDTASSSLDVFFDPSDGSISLPGITIGMFKMIKNCISAKGFSGTRRYFGDLGKTLKVAGSNVLFAAVTEISDNVLRGAESSGFKGLVSGFHQGILRLAMEPSFLGAAVFEGGPDRKIKLDRSPGVDELYIEGYLQAMLDVMYKQEYLRVRVIDNLVVLKNLPPNSSIINEILENVKSFLVSKALLKGDASASSRPLHHLRSEIDWKLGPTVLTLCEHLFVSFTIRMLRKQANNLIVIAGIKWRGSTKAEGGDQQKPSRVWAIGKFFLSGMLAYVDGRLCRHIPNPLARRIVSGFLLSFLDKHNGE